MNIDLVYLDQGCLRAVFTYKRIWRISTKGKETPNYIVVYFTVRQNDTLESSDSSNLEECWVHNEKQN